MTNSELYMTWFWSLALTAVVVVIAAGLLIAILLTARSVLNNARQALDAAEHIAADTQVIWELDRTNAIAGEILEKAGSIEARGERIVEALHAPQRVEQ